MDALRPGDPASAGGCRLLGRPGAGGMGQDADPRADPPWMVTAYVDGPSLQDAVERDGRCRLHGAGQRRLRAGLRAGLRRDGPAAVRGDSAAATMFRIIDQPPDLAGLGDGELAALMTGVNL